jgi:hypothetical protein
MACCNNPHQAIPFGYQLEVDHPSGGQKYSPGSKFNWGLTVGRMSSFPVGYLCFSKEEAEEMVRSGLVWRGVLVDHCRTYCGGCGKYLSWRPGMVVDDEHHKLAADCPWLARRDRGKDMELHLHWKMPSYLRMKYRENGKIDIVCIKCDVTFLFIKMEDGLHGFWNFNKEYDEYKRMHDELSPDCQ